MKISIESFSGTAPKIAASHLPASGAQTAENVRLTAGALRAINQPAVATSTAIAAACKSIYWLGPPNSNYLLSWSSDVDVAASPVSDSEYRIYYTGDGLPKKTSLTLATSGGAPYPSSWYFLGVPRPTAAPTLATTSGSVPSGTYVYVFTYVTQFGAVLLEESAPSPAATVTLGSTGGVVVTFPANPSTTGRNYVYKRVYRTTGTAFQLVAQVPFSNSSFTDTLAPSAILGDPLLTTDWAAPSDDLSGLCALPSGCMAAFRSNELWFSEPNYPHAWPAKYMQSFDAPIVGIKAFGNTIVVATKQHTYIGSGLYPDTFTFQKAARLEPCVSKRSMAVGDYGVIYASRNGLVLASSDGLRLLTDPVMTRHEFAAYTPDTLHGLVYEGRYYGFYSTPATGGALEAALVAPVSGEGGVWAVAMNASAATVEPHTGQMYYVDRETNGVRVVDPVGTVPMTYKWRSKSFMLPYPTNMSCFQVIGRTQTAQEVAYDAAVAAQNTQIIAYNATVLVTDQLESELNARELNALELNGSVLEPQIPTVAQTVSVTVRASGEVVWSGVCKFNTMYRLPSGFKSNEWDVEFVGQREIRAFEMAVTPMELKGS